MTPLDKTLKRIIRVKGEDFVVTLTPAAIKISRKGRRNGMEMTWESLVSGERALAVALQASLAQVETDTSATSPRVTQTTTKSAPHR